MEAFPPRQLAWPGRLADRATRQRSTVLNRLPAVLQAGSSAGVKTCSLLDLGGCTARVSAQRSVYAATRSQRGCPSKSLWLRPPVSTAGELPGCVFKRKVARECAERTKLW